MIKFAVICVCPNRETESERDRGRERGEQANKSKQYKMLTESVKHSAVKKSFINKAS